MEKEIVRLDDTARGICYVDGKVTFVPKTVENDIVSFNIIKSKKNYNEGKLEKIIKSSSKRVQFKCPYFNECGGCDLQHLSYDDGLKYKIDVVINQFNKKGFNVQPIIIKNPNPFYYRNKITLKVVDGKVGFYESKSHDLIEISTCFIAQKSLNKIIPFIKQWQIQTGEVVLRCNQNDEILINIKTNDNVNIDIDSLKKQCKLCGIILNGKTIYNENFLYERINNLVFRISYDSFFQVNYEIATKLFQIIKENVATDDCVLDLYCGVGTLSLNAAINAKVVIGIEIVPNAVLNAISNVKINKINNAEFVLNDASLAVTKLNSSFNKLIVDPPRSGLAKNVIDLILNRLPKTIIYVSCNVHTLVRDLELLIDKYEIKKLYILDMFSYTYHVECVCVLNLRKPL